MRLEEQFSNGRKYANTDQHLLLLTFVAPRLMRRLLPHRCGPRCIADQKGQRLPLLHHSQPYCTVAHAIERRSMALSASLAEQNSNALARRVPSSALQD